MSPIIGSLAGASTRGFGGFRVVAGASAVESFDSIASYTVPSDTGSIITLGSIPSTYKHLMLIVSAGATFGGSGGGSGGRLYFNSNTGITCNYANFNGNGNGTITGGYASQTWFDFGALWAGNGNQYGQAIWIIYDYANTTKHKTVQWQSGASLLAGTNGTNSGTTWSSGNWASTAAISAINLHHGSAVGGDGDLRAGSRFSVFGMKG